MQLASAVAPRQDLQEAQEVGPVVRGRELPGDLAAGDLQRGVHVGEPGPAVVVGVPCRDALPQRQMGCVRSSAWLWVFSSTQSTSALVGGARYRPQMSLGLLGRAGVVGELEGLGGWSAWSRQMQRAVSRDSPTSAARSRVDPCV